MAFSDADPLFGSVGLCGSQPSVWYMRWESTTTGPGGGSQADEAAAEESVPAAAEPITRFQYHKTDLDLERWRQEQLDRREEERSGEAECLICSLKDPDGSGNYQQVLDYYHGNRRSCHPGTLHKEVCEKYKDKVWRLPALRKGESCSLPLLQPRHLRRHERECVRDIYDDAEEIADRLKERILKKIEEGIQVDTQTGLQEIDPNDTHRALSDWLSYARFLAQRPASGDGSSGSTTTISVNSKRGRGKETAVSVSALVGLQKEKRQKRLDSYTLSRWG